MKREELLKAMKSVMLGVSSGNDSIFFDKHSLRSKTDVLTVSVSNVKKAEQKVVSSYPLETGLECAVKAEEFYKILSKMTKDEVTLKMSDGKLLVTDKKTRIKLVPIPEKDYLKMKAEIDALTIEDSEWKPLPKGFNEGLPLSLFSTGKDANLGKISGVIFKDDSIISTDNFRVSHYKMEGKMPVDIVRLRSESIANFIRLGSNFEYAAIKGFWFHLKNANGSVAAHVLPSAEYPLNSVLKIFDNLGFYGSEVPVQEFPKDIIDSIERAEIMASESELDFTTQITIRKAEEEGQLGLMLSGKKTFGEVEDFIPWDGMLPDPIIASPSFLKKILTMTRQFKISPVKKGLLFETANFKFLMLARIGGME